MLATPLDILKRKVFVAHPLLQEYLTEDRTAKVCHIIGGGPSLLEYLPQLQKDSLSTRHFYSIAVNNAYKLFPNSLCCHFMDFTWWKDHNAGIYNIHEHFSKPITTSAHVNNKLFISRGEEPIVFKRGESTHLSVDPSVLNGNNSGYSAINLALLLGFKKLVLHGFDLDAEATVTHWHSEHRKPVNRGNFRDSMLPAFDALTDQIVFDLFKAKIYNASLNSKITSFEKIAYA